MSHPKGKKQTLFLYIPYQVVRKFRVRGGEGQEDIHIIAGFILSHKD